MKTILIILLLGFSTAFAQQFATVDGGGRVLLYEDGTWSKVGEAKPDLELPTCSRTIMRSQIINDELHLTISDNGKESKQVESIEVLSTKEKNLSGYYINGSDSRWRDPYPVKIIIHNIRIGTELFSHQIIQNPPKKKLWKERDRKSGSTEVHLNEKEFLKCISTYSISARSNNQARFWQSEINDSLTLTEAKVLAANMYQDILAIRLMD